jgi:hypothetical protein
MDWKSYSVINFVLNLGAKKIQLLGGVQTNKHNFLLLLLLPNQLNNKILLTCILLPLLSVIKTENTFFYNLSELINVNET